MSSQTFQISNDTTINIPQVSEETVLISPTTCSCIGELAKILFSGLCAWITSYWIFIAVDIKPIPATITSMTLGCFCSYLALRYLAKDKVKQLSIKSSESQSLLPNGRSCATMKCKD